MAEVTRDELKKIILDVITRSSGIKNVDLALKVLERTLPSYFESEFYQECLDELVSQDMILEVEYVLPDTEYRSKSIFFPKGTRVAA